VKPNGVHIGPLEHFVYDISSQFRSSAQFAREFRFALQVIITSIILFIYDILPYKKQLEIKLRIMYTVKNKMLILTFFTCPRKFTLNFKLK